MIGPSDDPPEEFYDDTECPECGLSEQYCDCDTCNDSIWTPPYVGDSVPKESEPIKEADDD